MKHTRIEKDSMGELEVPHKALYGAQTQRAVNNFPISNQSMPKPFIEALLTIKLVAANTNKKLELLAQPVTEAIVSACTELLANNNLMSHFPVDIFQTGSGTSSNMNANEVIATIASQHAKQEISPNDHVNYGQSSNDVIPTAIHLTAALLLENSLLPALTHLVKETKYKAKSLTECIKTGRTHLMDAMPVSLEQTLNGWAAQIEEQIALLKRIQPSLHALAQGGTAVGTGVNAHPQFAEIFAQELSQHTNIEFSAADNLFARIGSQDTAVSLSGQLKSLSVTLMKISNDLRWMNSGPLAGLSEISLEALQPGSSIMPGKVNPVIPEATAMVCAQVIGNDTAITVAGQSGNFELNVMLPMIANNLISSLTLLSNASTLLADKAIKSFSVNNENLTRSLAKNPILVTALNPVIGYIKAAEIAKIAYKEKRDILDVAAEHTDIDIDELKTLLDPKRLISGGT
ncbi:class II fumarate hydratase [Thalassotalea fusca]